MNKQSISLGFKKEAAKTVLHYLDGDIEENLPKLMKWVDKFDKDDKFLSQRTFFHRIIDDRDCNWHKLIMSVFNDIDRDVVKTVFENFFVNAAIAGFYTQVELKEKYDCNIPWAILMDPTTACNLHCTGCWAAEYGNKLNMDYEMLSDIVVQGRELGVYMYIFSGGEPLVRKKDIIKLCETYSDCEFLAFTNGTLIDEEFADDMLRVKNFVPAISVEGFENATDLRRGNGTFHAVLHAMEILRKKRLPFGVSCCYTSANVDSISSEEFIDFIIEQGAKFAWYFHYMPVGNEAVPDLLPSPAQRKKMYDTIRGYRSTKPLFTIDFQNDGQYIGGCVAGGRCYLHINANGDIEPCAFIHYSDSNIYEKSLLDALRSPLFMSYHNLQPFNSNHLKPCPMLENAGCLEYMVNKTGAHSTDMQSPEPPENLTKKCMKYAKDWAPTADELWKNTPKKAE